MIIKYSEPVFVALGIHHAKHMCYPLLSFVAFRLYSNFPRCYHKRNNCRKVVIKQFFFLWKFWAKQFSFQEEFSEILS